MFGSRLDQATLAVRRLIDQAAGDPALRDVLQTLTLEILRTVDTDEPGPPSRPPEPLRTLTLGQGSSRPPVEKPERRPTDDLGPLAARCQVNADAARAAAEAERALREGAGGPDLAPSPDDATRAAFDRLTDAYHWAVQQDGRPAIDPSRLDDVGGAYEAVAAAASLASRKRQRPADLEKLLPLAAEAQSALRRALMDIGIRDDPDQLEAYEWVHATAARYRIYIHHHFRADDLADPSGWPDLVARLEALTGGGPLERKAAAALDAVRDHQDRIHQGHGTSDDWTAVLSAIDELVSLGVPPSHRQLREFLLPVVDELPDDAGPPPGVLRVLREIDRYLSDRPTRGPSETDFGLSEDVAVAARLLEGRSVLLIGGVRRPAAQRMLEKALRLQKLIWISTREHQSIRSFGPLIARSEVAVVLLAIRWSSHSFGEVLTFCEQYGKPLVRLPAGYSPNQVAAQVLAQCSERLGAAGP